MIIVQNESAVFRKVNVTKKIIVDESKYNDLINDGISETDAIEMLLCSEGALVLDERAVLVE